MVRAVVCGASGRMGGRVVHQVIAHPELTLAGAVERPDHPAVGQDAGVVAGAEPQGVAVVGNLAEALGGADVVLDFTHPEASIAHLNAAAEGGCAVVIGTTGFTDEQRAAIEKTGPTTRSVVAPNMSVGVNVMFKVAAELARLLGEDYDVEIVEAHHRFKKDAPSGTAVRLAEVVAEALGRDLESVGVYGRQGIIGERTDEEIAVMTLRAGDITGEHTLMFGGIGERVELIHRAHNRDNFARGAARAARWVVDQPPGLYDMQDVLGLRE
ncbi:MAG: 4-hydroxy-tetrahydrodipicolinate reductase [bacterium]|nr:4-hydroxy-tetrahydrodipicolinate reductase [bacterium]